MRRGESGTTQRPDHRRRPPRLMGPLHCRKVIGMELKTSKFLDRWMECTALSAIECAISSHETATASHYIMKNVGDTGVRTVVHEAHVTGIMSAKPQCLNHRASITGAIVMTRAHPLKLSQADAHKGPSESASYSVATRAWRGVLIADWILAIVPTFVDRSMKVTGTMIVLLGWME